MSADDTAVTPARRDRRSLPAPTGPPTLEKIEELPEILNKGQAAWLLQVSTGHLEGAAQRGEIPSALIGNTRRFSKHALLASMRGEH